MDLKQLNYFIAVAEELHFNRAAYRLNISQPALSLQIKALENRIGGALFHRTSRSVELTEAGRVLYVSAKEILERTRVAEMRTRQVLRGDLATLRLAYSGGAFFSGVLQRAIRAVRQRMPGIDFELFDEPPRRQAERLQNRKIHAGLMTTRGISLPDALEAITLAKWPVQVALPCDHVLAQEAEIVPEYLLNETFYTYAEAQLDNEHWIRTILGTVPKSSHSVTSIDMVITLVGAGLGVALLPASVFWKNPDNAVVFKPLRGARIMMDCSLVRQKSEPEPGILRALECMEGAFLKTSVADAG